MSNLAYGTPSPAEHPADLRPQRPWGVWFIVVVLAVESVVLLVAAVFAVVSLFPGEREVLVSGTSLASGIFLVVLCLLFGGGLAAVSAQLARGFRWTRSATFVWQLLTVTLIVPALLSGYWLAIPALVPPILVLILLFSPRVVAFTMRQAQPPAL
ncbi:hypothetical protein ODZ83_04290 [Acaricomes phytoseiuli]|uniref:hypothetical protein n=1 Tax=Acaricomes phytoseiuli TaxID=291968 RepID=UPI0003A4BC62|nr:hypothetical protein [Acaricomes phytoseiuli]MCW1249413.1 hypothetical protein [Acaricomes phytoseiuli]